MDGPGGAAGTDRIDREANRRLAVDLARAFAGALIFALPMLMTMELWWIGFYVDPLRLALLTVIAIPLLIGLSYFTGFRPTFRLHDALQDACIAYGIGWITSAVMLGLLGVLKPGMPPEAMIGQIAVQAMPAGIGAALARSMLGSQGDRRNEERKKDRTSYGGELFLMAVGAIFLAINLAPTEEMILIALKMSISHTLGLVALSLLVMHGFVYAVEFHGSPSLPPDTPFHSAFLRFTIAGYALALLMSLYILWTFGRTDDMSLEAMLQAAVVLGFPAAVGAAAARLII